MTTEFTKEYVLYRITEKMRVSSINGVKRRHKPLLLLWALVRCLNGNDRLTEFANLEPDLEQLLQQYSPNSSKTLNPQWPFQFLCTDEIWEIEDPSGAPIPNRQLEKAECRNKKLQGGFIEPVFNLFCSDKLFAVKCIYVLLHKYFPESLHFTILESIDPELLALALVGHGNEDLIGSFGYGRPRDPNFRREVLKVWRHRCAVCDMSIEYSGIYPALEAAHIKWHCDNGPDTTNNGLALCSVHHRLFDFGMFTIKRDSLEVISTDFSAESDDWLYKYKGKKLDCSKFSSEDRPSNKFLAWHGENVFKIPYVLQK